MNDKVLFVRSKQTYSPLGMILRRIRQNTNLLQSEMARVLELKHPSELSKIELGGKMDEETFEIMKREYHLEEEEIKEILPYIRPKSEKRKKKFDPIKMNLGTRVKEIYSLFGWTAFSLSKALNEASYFIGAIETHNQPFTEKQLNDFIIFFDLKDQAAEELQLLNDHFESQPKDRQDTTTEIRVKNMIALVKPKTKEELRELVFKVRSSQ